MLAIKCAVCSGPMARRAGAVYCSKRCKLRASEARRTRDDSARYQLERDRRITYALAYARQHPEVGQTAKARRKARLRGAGVFTVSARDWMRLCARHRWTCFYCGARAALTMDHVVPIVRGGRHSIGNIVPACGPCNSSKSRRFIVEWRARKTVAGGDSHPLEAVRTG